MTGKIKLSPESPRVMLVVARMVKLSEMASSALSEMSSSPDPKAKRKAGTRFSAASSELSARMDTLSAFVGKDELEQFASRLGGKWDWRTRRLLFPEMRGGSEKRQ